MKTNKSRLFTLLALGGLMAVSPIVRAEDAAPAAPSPTAPAPNDAAGKGHANMREQMEKMFTAISATDEQKEKLKAIFKDRNEKFKALRDDTSVSKEDRASKRKDIMKDINAKVKDAISADQYAEYMKFQHSLAKGGKHAQPDTAAPTTPPADAPKN